MVHKSVRLENSAVEFINIVPYNPLISQVQIKVCYVSDEPNRNKSVITKEVATQMANTLPGCPIVGYYNEDKEDFEEHNRMIDISNGKFQIKDTTKPYGFVDLNAKVWFQKFIDDDTVEREYLMTEGWIWTGQYEEANRIIEKGNNQSMELDEKTLNAFWSKDNNGKSKFFIINEAIISKLCILGEECEPCFEGSNITAPTIQFSFSQGFEDKMISMVKELKDLLKEGGTQVFTTYAVEIGDALWSALYGYLDSKYSETDSEGWACSVYRIEGIYEEGTQKFAILQHRSSMKYFRLDFTFGEDGTLAPSDSLIEVTQTFVPAAEPQFATEAVSAFEAEFFAKKKDKKEQEEGSETEETTEEENKTSEGKEDSTEEEEEEEKKKKKQFAKEEETCEECGKPISECECEEKEEEKTTYSLEEIPEYIELQTQFAELEEKYNNLMAEVEAKNNELTTLREFKLEADRKEKQEMIESFYMLSDEDKADVVQKIDTYSLEEIEAKLSVICVRNKVSFNLEEETPAKETTTYNLDGETGDETVPAWIKAVRATAKNY